MSPCCTFVCFCCFCCFFLNSGERSLLKSVERVLEVQGKPSQVVHGGRAGRRRFFVVDARDAVVLCCVCVRSSPHPMPCAFREPKKNKLRSGAGERLCKKHEKSPNSRERVPRFPWIQTATRDLHSLAGRQENRVGIWARDVIPREGDPNGPKTLNRSGKAVDRERNKPRGKSRENRPSVTQSFVKNTDGV